MSFKKLLANTCQEEYEATEQAREVRGSGPGGRARGRGHKLGEWRAGGTQAAHMPSHVGFGLVDG